MLNYILDEDKIVEIKNKKNTLNFTYACNCGYCHESYEFKRKYVNNPKCRSHITPLIYNCKNYEILEIMIKYGADTYFNNYNILLYDEILNLKSVKILIMDLVKNGNIEKVMLEKNNRIGHITIGSNLLIRYINVEYLKCFFKYVPKNIMTAAINNKNKNGETILHELFTSSKLNIDPNLIINENEDVDKKYSEYTGRYIVNEADIIELLVKNGISINEKDNDGNTPILLTNKYNSYHELLRLGADVNLTNNNGYSVAKHLVKTRNFGQLNYDNDY